MRFLCLAVVFTVTVAVAQAQFRCPEPDGTFEDDKQCDKYYECYDGVAEERLCPDGLVFDPFSRKREVCDHYFNVDCGQRLELQTPKGPNDLCPRLNGFYAHPDPAVCSTFYACVEGVAEPYYCAPGLWFDEFRGVCNWPGETSRTDCQAVQDQTDSGFQCPATKAADDFGVSDPHPKYADPQDCAKFFICLNGISPREQGCELGLVFDTVSRQCVDPANVPECKDYYAFLEEDDAELAGLKQKQNRARK